MDFEKISQKILGLKEEDDKIRAKLVKNGALSNGYNQEMKVIHNSNAEELNRIMDLIGFPTAEKVGEKASNAAWFIIQHSIGQPDFMKKCASLMKKEVENRQADQIDFAYLTDRISVLEGKAQIFGTQFDWDEHGEMSPIHIDDYHKVNVRRKALGLKSLHEQTKVMRERTKAENQQPPKNYQERKRAYNEWRKSVGWIK
jgi:hypothetical protein